MRLHKLFLFLIGLIVFWLPFNLAAYSFVVHFIQIRGLHGILESTVRSYFPIREGQKYTSQRGQAAIVALYKTGFFDNIQLSHRGKVLIIIVKERPIISLICLNGNKAIASKKLQTILNKLGITEGQHFDPVKLKQIKQGLEQQYDAMGYHATHISTNVIRESRNLVVLHININEGRIAKIHSIQFVGNHVFSEHTLHSQFKLTNPNLFTWISHADYYSQMKLEQDLESLTAFYLNHGYLNFRIISCKIRWSPDKKSVDIIIFINEGPVYRVSGYKINGKNYSFTDRLRKLIALKTGDVFSRQVVIDINKKIVDFLADQGYAFARVIITPKIDDQRHLVHINFDIISGKRIYVRRINFLGNQRTDQEVLRREMRQYEGSIYSLSKIEESKRRLELLGYLSDVTYTLKSVPNFSNQVDLCYYVKEIVAGRVSIQGGYSDVYGFLYGATMLEPNFMGTGKYIAIGLQNSQYQQNYSISYKNPYYTTYGLQRGFLIYYSRIKPDKKFNLTSYLEDGYGSDVTYGYPISERNSITFGCGLEHITISQIDIANAAPSMLAFLGTTNGVQNTSANYNQVRLTASLVYNGFNRTIFPTKGLYTGLDLEVGVPIFKSSLNYYLVTYIEKYYQPLDHGFILNLLATLGYGDGFGHGRLPFFKNFFSGGIGSVPAFAPNSLGPKNRYPLGRDFGAIGGNLETIFGVHLILPQFFSQTIRTAVAFDTGNVFQVPRFPGDIAIPAHGGPSDPESNTQPQIIQDDKFSLKNFRPSLGLSMEWYTPFAPINFTLAFPLNRQAGDNFQAFQFSLGMSL